MFFVDPPFILNQLTCETARKEILAERLPGCILSLRLHWEGLQGLSFGQLQSSPFSSLDPLLHLPPWGISSFLSMLSLDSVTWSVSCFLRHIWNWLCDYHYPEACVDKNSRIRTGFRDVECIPTTWCYSCPRPYRTDGFRIICDLLLILNHRSALTQ